MKSETMMLALICLCVTVGVIMPLHPTATLAKASAQTTAAQEQTPRERLQAAVDSLNLTEEQKSKLKPMFADAKAKGQAVLDNSALTDDQKKAQLKEIFANLKKNVNSVLTPEQQAQVKAKVEAAKAKNM